VTLSVELDGLALGRLHHDIEDESFKRAVLGVPGSGATLGKRRARVRFTVSTRYAWSKNYCFYARAERGRP
jgi:hypothetical protein